MKATTANFARYLTTSFAAAAFLAAAAQGATASQAHLAEATVSIETRMPQLLGGLMLAEPLAVVAAKPFQFDRTSTATGSLREPQLIKRKRRPASTR